MLQAMPLVDQELVGAGITDEEAVQRVLAGETRVYEVLMRRYNQRLYRVAYSILGNDAEAEDVMQEAYVRAFHKLSTFAGASKFSTWLTKIAVYEALARRRMRGRLEELEPETESKWSEMKNPEQQAYNLELKELLERAISALPEGFRSVFMLRAVEGLSVAESADCLGVTEDTVKTRLHRARLMLRSDIEQHTGIAAAQTFSFHLSRCDVIVQSVFRRIAPK